MKILTSDLDGTLYFGSEIGIKKEDAIAIKEFQKQGNLFGLCSGRTLVGVHHALDGLDIQLDFMILVSGSMIVDKDENYILCHRINRQLAIDIIDEIKDCKGSILLCRDHNYYRMNSPLYSQNHEVLIKDPRETKNEDFDSIHIRFDDEQELLQVKETIDQKFQGQISTYQNILNLDLCPYGMSKGNAVNMLTSIFNVNKKDIYSIGDSFNDISMLESTKTSFTFHSSPDAVKNKATHVVHSIKEAIDYINLQED